MADTDTVLEVEARLQDYISKNLKTIERNLINFSTKAEEKIGKAGQQVSKFNQMWQGVKGSILQVAKSLGPAALAFIALQKAIRAVGDATKFLIETNITFEKTISRIQAILKPTANELDAITEKARELGKNTVFSASQAGEAFVEMGKRGFEASQIIAASSGVLDLAAASQVAMSEAASATVATLNQFNLQAGESSHVVDVMTKSFTSSALEMYSFTEGMKMVGPVAGSTNVSLETTTGLLSVLADREIKGTMAGTALRRIFLELADSGSKASKIIQQSGKEAFTLADKFKILRDAGVGVTEITEMFGLRATTAAQILLRNVDSVEKLTEAYENADGTAKEMADTMIDNVYGATVRLKSAQEELALTLGETLQPVLRQWKEMLIGITRWLTVVIQETYGVKFAAKQLEIEKSMSKQFDIEFQLMEIEKEITTIRSGHIRQVTNTKRNMEGVVDTQATLTELLERQADLQKQLRIEEGKEVTVQEGIKKAFDANIKRRKKEVELAAMLAEGKTGLGEDESKIVEEREKKKAKLKRFFEKWAIDEISDVRKRQETLDKKAASDAEALERKKAAITAESLAALEEMKIHHSGVIKEIGISEWSSEAERLDLQMEYEKNLINLQYERKIEAAKKIGADITAIEEASQLEKDILIKRHEDIRSKIVRDNAKAGLDMVVSNLRTMATENKKYMTLYKLAASAQCIIDTYASAQASFKAMAGIPYVGPALGIAAAAIAVGAGLANLAQIKKASFATGVSYAPGGEALVGERGMELITGPKSGYLPKGSTVYNNKETTNMLGGNSVNINVTIPDNAIVDRDAAEFIVERVERIKEDLIYAQSEGILDLTEIAKMG